MKQPQFNMDAFDFYKQTKPSRKDWLFLNNLKSNSLNRCRFESRSFKGSRLFLHL